MKILVSYDGSMASRKALKLAQAHADIYGAKLEVAKSVTRNGPLKYREVQVAEDRLEEEVRSLLNGKNVRFETHLLITDKSSGEILVWFAEMKKVDEIYVGARKRSKAGKFLLGSTTQYIVLHARCPVVSVK
jgi:nucleotide-binding universal stress UspA family protein